MTPNSSLSVATRIGLLHAGLLDVTAIKDLISEVAGTTMVYYLPPEIAKYAQELMARKEVKIRES
jgi:hypothetical protein